MAVQLERVWNGVTGGLEQFTDSNGTPSVQSTNKEQDTHALELASGDDVSLIISRDLDGGGRIKCGFRIFITAAPSSAGVICGVCQSGDVTIEAIEIRLNTDRTLSILDTGGTARATTSDTIPTSTWTTLEFYAQLSSTGTAGVRINGGTETTASSFNFTNNPSASDGFFMRGVAGATVRFDRCFAYSGLSGDTVTITTGNDGDFACKGYQPGSGSTANNTGLPGGDAHTLEGGTVADWDDRPIVEEATTPKITDNDSVAYECDASGGNQYNGPNGDSDINTVLGAEFGLWALRGNGGGTTHTIYGGNSGDGLTAVATPDLGTAFAYHYAVSESATVVPTASEDAAIGFGVSGARDMEVTEAFVTVLSDVYVAPPADIPFLAQAIMVQ